MTPKSGTHEIGPSNGQVTVSTYVGGVGAKMGHDLVLAATRWSGSVTIDAANPAASTAQITIDARSLEILQATGGLKALSDKDKAEITANQEKTLQVAKFPEITFQSTAVSGTGPQYSLQGNLTIAGTSRPVTLVVDIEDDGGQAHLTATATVVQTEFGVKPYSKLGALKVKDPVDLQIDLTLPPA